LLLGPGTGLVNAVLVAFEEMFFEIGPNLYIDRCNKGGFMRKWAVPLTVLGLGGIGALAFSRRGRGFIRWAAENVQHAPGKIADWNETAQTELDKIQNALNDIAESLQTRPAR